MENNNISLELGEHGFYSVKINEFHLINCKIKIEIASYDRTPNTWEITKTNNNSSYLLTGENEYGKWKAEFCIKKECLLISVKGETTYNNENIRISPLVLPTLESSHVLTQGIKMGGCSSLFTNLHNNTEFEGFYQLIISKNNKSLQLSFPLYQENFSKFSGKISEGCIKDLAAYCDIVKKSPGEPITTETLKIRYSDNGIELMNQYADEQVASADKKDFSNIKTAGWNSWDYYRWTITEEEVLKNAEFIASDPVLSKYVKRIIIDDGWEYCYGEWEANSNFPSGMENLAKKLAKMGFEPGLWFAPTIVEPHARIAQLDYDMLALGESGLPCMAFSCMQRRGFVLDPTQEKVRKHLYSIFLRYKKMGYKYFKLDFMAQTFNAKKFADNTASPSKIQELIVLPVYNAVKPDGIILGCNYIFGGGNKFVDMVRIGSDIHAWWEALKKNTVSVAARFWCNNKLWINDPDFALCRGEETSDDPNLKRLKPCLVFVTPDTSNENAMNSFIDLSIPQIEILLSVVIMSGGAVNLSDNMLTLNEAGLDLARRTVSAPPAEAGIPLDLFNSEIPSLWIQKSDSFYRLLFINWSDTEKEFVFDLRHYGLNPSRAVDFWHDSPVNTQNGKIQRVLPPRSCLMSVLYS